MSAAPGADARAASSPTARAAALLTLAAFLIGPVALLAPLGLAPLLTVVALGLAAIAACERRWPVPAVDLGLALALLCALALASALWAVDPEHSAWRAIRLIGEAVEGVLLIDAGARLAPAARRRVLTALAAGLALTSALAIADWLSAGALMRGLHGPRARVTTNNRGATVLAILLWPALVLPWRARGPVALLGGWVIGALGVAACLSASAHVALALATVCGALAWWFGRAAARVAVVVAGVVVIVMPLLTLLAPRAAADLPDALMKPSAIHRLVIWRFTDARIGERPLLGWGLDASRAIPGGKEVTMAVDRSGQVLPLERMPLHPHNGALQLWLELGALGALVGAFVVMVAAGRLTPGALYRPARAAGLAAFAAAAVEVSISYGMWQSWWIAALWLAGFAVQLTLEDA